MNPYGRSAKNHLWKPNEMNIGGRISEDRRGGVVEGCFLNRKLCINISVIFVKLSNI